MTKTLILIRHAKSDWDDPLLDDHDRPLNPRGHASAPRIGKWLSAQGVIPDTVLCSSALRTRETWNGIVTHLSTPPEATVVQSLYHASPDHILTKIQRASGDTVAVIGHNPGIGALAWALAAPRPKHPRFGLYPTGATLILDCSIRSWSECIPGETHTRAFMTPRDLPDLA